MNIYCPKGLHVGVFQGLDGDLCKHQFWVNQWESYTRPKPSNVHVMNKEILENPDDKFFGAILVQGIGDYELVKNYEKTIIYYDLMNGRNGEEKLPWQNKILEIYKNSYVIPLFISTSCRMSHGIYSGLHKTIYPGLDENLWSGWVGKEEKIIHVRNSFKQRDIQKYNDFIYVCDNMPYTLIGHEGNLQCSEKELIEQYKNHRLFLNIEIYTSTFSIASMEAMMTGMPIICNDIEGTGEAIRNGVEGFISNNLDYLKKKTKDLINDYDMAKEIGKNAREMAKIKFGKKQFNIAWNDFLDNIDYYKRA